MGKEAQKNGVNKKECVTQNTIIMGKEAQKNDVNKKECVTQKKFCVTHQDNQKTICHKLF